MAKVRFSEKDFRAARKDERAKAAVKALTDYVNAGHNTKNFCVLMSLEHRTLQAWATDLVIEWLRQLAMNGDSGMIDGRNKSEARAARVMIDALDEYVG